MEEHQHSKICKSQEALDDCKEIIKLNDQYAPVYHITGYVYQMMGIFEDAIRNFDRFVDLFPVFFEQVYEVEVNLGLNSMKMFCDVVLRRAVCYIGFKDYDTAMNDINFVLSIEDGTFKDLAYHYRGKCWLDKNEWWKVIEDNTSALSMNKSLINAYYDRSSAYSQLGLEKEAAEDRRMFGVLNREKIWKGQL